MNTPYNIYQDSCHYGAHRGENGGPLHGELLRHNTKLHAALEPNHAVLEPLSNRLLLQPHEQTQRNPSTVLWPQTLAVRTGWRIAGAAGVGGVGGARAGDAET